MSKRKPIDYNSIPKKLQLFGRTIDVIDDSASLSISRNYGEARYGVNQIALNSNVAGNKINPEELKLTFIHEMLHFILNFTNYEQIIRDNQKIDIEQFIELLASGIYQYEKTSEFKTEIVG